MSKINEVVTLACHTASGDPSVYTYSTAVEAAERAKGVHIERARNAALKAGYQEPMVAFDRDHQSELSSGVEETGRKVQRTTDATRFALLAVTDSVRDEVQFEVSCIRGAKDMHTAAEVALVMRKPDQMMDAFVRGGLRVDVAPPEMQALFVAASRVQACGHLDGLVALQEAEKQPSLSEAFEAIWEQGGVRMSDGSIHGEVGHLAYVAIDEDDGGAISDAPRFWRRAIKLAYGVMIEEREEGFGRPREEDLLGPGYFKPRGPEAVAA
ncbi:hypothetical protein TK90_2636 (plasmid) [Thioalkalivibrio sp. K90mix]|uniref:hypothetical protein n=1 Tax=Thioalkalivibrio sp. (strain K90mix) TaxID=396595 RepID=UPI000195AB98|nr:hypothetical protein [Thioalkalivibrio sp. K90mix]ADC73123.1 hypothetical protein TK90_2636 [Thioalkalivibrio sp. K90mix]